MLTFPSIVSDKVGPNHRYVGIEPFVDLLNRRETAFAYVIEESTVPFMLTMAKASRDVDLIEEPFGE